ncbi:MAG: hypothetical protein LAT64_06950 [Phycisphaerales bacterium]|nr:hypothetical protein [Planctomycetota bacterium]MCH8508492.1 hypothetical protein [Phycisphaerales bacterium]
MKRTIKNTAKIAAVLAVGGTMTVAATSYAGGFDVDRDCLPGVFCLDVWMPVLCPDGNVYSNDCYAAKACQRNCIPYYDIMR